MIPWETVAACVKAPPANVQANWPIVYAGLADLGIAQTPVQIAAAATVAVETGSFKPITEIRASKERNPKIWELQEKYWQGGYYGRGYIQLTHEANYREYGDALGLDLVAHPDLALEPRVAGKILARYFRVRDVDGAAMRRDWRAVRKKVNGGYHGWDVFFPVVEALGAATKIGA